MVALYALGAAGAAFCCVHGIRNRRIAKFHDNREWEKDAFWLAVLWALIAAQNAASAVGAA